NDKITTFNSLIEYLTNNKVIIKPYKDRDGGKGVKVLSWACNDIYFINDEQLSKDNLENYITTLDGYMISENLVESHVSASFFEDSVNTIRILTMKSPDSGLPFIAQAVFRIGTVESAPVDNWSKGGISVSIDT